MDVDLSPNALHTDIAAPSRYYLLLHGSVARVLQMSARGEKIEQFWHDYAGIKVLSKDGGDAENLMTALLLLQIAREDTDYQDNLDDDPSLNP
jgi:hypothetical protein